jgi:hypothetical protein
VSDHRVDLTGDYETTVYDAARRLLAEGADLADTVETWRDSKLSMSGVIGVLAKRQVVFASTGARLVRHKDCISARLAAETASGGSLGLPTPSGGSPA